MAEPDDLTSYMPARRRNPDNLDNADSRDTNPSGGSPVQNPFGGSGSNDGYERFMTLHRGARGTLKSDRKGEMRYISGPYKGMTEGQGDIIGNNTFSRMSDQERDRYRPINAADRSAAAAAEEQSFQKGLEREKIVMKERLKIEAEQRAAQTTEDAKKLEAQRAKEEADKASKKTTIVGSPFPSASATEAAKTTPTTGSTTPAVGASATPATASTTASPAAAGAAAATTPTVPVAPVTNPAETNKTSQPSATSSPIEEGKVSQAPVMNPMGRAANSMSQPSFGNRSGSGASQTGITEELRRQNIAKRMA